MVISRQQFNKIETYLLSILLYGIVLVYTYQYFQFADKYEPWTTDELFYYIEAKAIAAHNIYQTPASLDGNTSYIGDFGFHAVSYAIKDGWLAKLFFHTQDPPLLLINFITCIGVLVLILLFKQFSFNIRLKIALVVATHYILYSYTLSYMQETIQYFFAVLALEALYLLYLSPLNRTTKYLVYFLVVITVAITFRYGWFMWGAGLLPLSTNLKSFIKWCLVAIGLLVFGVFVSRYIVAPYPYYDMTGDSIINAGNFSLINSLTTAWQKFRNNLQLFLIPDPKLTTTCMRYLLLMLLLISSWYAIFKRNKFTIACTLVSWAYFVACLTFYEVYWSYDERALAVLNPILGFSLVGNANSFIFYPVIILQLWLFPDVVRETKERNMASILVNANTPERVARKNSYSKIKDLVNDNENTVVGISIGLVRHGTEDYFISFPLINNKGYPIHYRIYRNGRDLRNVHKLRYFLDPSPAALPANNQLIYSDSWMNLYRFFN